MSDKNTAIPIDTTDGPPQRTLLVGTAVSVTQLHRALSQSNPKLQAVGCLLPSGVAGGLSATVPVPILGHLAALEDAIQTHGPFDQVLISLPVAMGQLTRQITHTLDQAGVAWRWMPTLADQLAGRLGVAAGGPIGQADPSRLINRHPQPLDEHAIRDQLAGRCVLITGAGGSIGSELARRAAGFHPAKLDPGRPQRERAV